MNDWFTVEKLDAQTFAISENKHWEETHCYLLLGQERALLIDTGLGVANIRQIVDSLTKLPVMATATHAHWDHIGGHSHFPSIAAHALEKDWLSVQFPIPLQAIKSELTKFPCAFPAEFDIDAYHIFQGTPQRILRDGDWLDLGNRKLQVVHTPGHSPGHCCFYEPGRNYLFTGDLIYKGCLYASYPTTDPLLFHDSVRRVQGYDVARIFPGHHSLDIPVTLIDEIESGFAQLKGSGQLKHGSGLFEFGNFQIQI